VIRASDVQGGSRLPTYNGYPGPIRPYGKPSRIRLDFGPVNVGLVVGQHLVFLLYAPLGAMGGVAVGERRAGFDRPGKSAILGLVAAGLGLDRSDEAGHAALADGYGLGLGEIASGQLLYDYQTTQAPPKRQYRRFTTRRAELDADDLGTLLSVREYRSGPAYLVVLWPCGASPWGLGQLGEALKRPHYPLYFGRKACPLACRSTPE
jgi:CRISPR system Cascade subunit CasD